MDEFLNGTFRMKSFNGSWSKDSKIIWTAQVNTIITSSHFSNYYHILLNPGLPSQDFREPPEFLEAF